MTPMFQLIEFHLHYNAQLVRETLSTVFLSVLSSNSVTQRADGALPSRLALLACNRTTEVSVQPRLPPRAHSSVVFALPFALRTSLCPI